MSANVVFGSIFIVGSVVMLIVLLYLLFTKRTGDELLVKLKGKKGYTYGL